MTAPRPRRKARNRRHPLVLERMERRDLMTVLMVTNNGDQGGGTLRQAILDANANPGPDQIFFGLAPNQLTIQPISALPALSDPGTVLDATTQPGYNKLAPKPLVVLDGSLAGTNVTGLTITGGNTTVKGLVVENFAPLSIGAGISISGGGRDTIQGNYIGTNSAGNGAASNSGDGLDIASSNNTIGGSARGEGNVISANGFNGINLSGFATTGNVIQGNIIGLAADGTTPLGNTFTGINSFVASGTQIGGIAVGTRNVISANGSGIFIQGIGPSATTIQGNYIGTDVTGTIAKPNKGDGVTIFGGANNLIGGIGAAGNVISGNQGRGVFLQGASARNNLVKGNRIGVAANGTSPLGNAQEGVNVQGAINAVIGGFSAAEGNTIAYNGSLFKTGGVYVQSGSSIAILSNSIFSNVGTTTVPGGINISRGANNNQAAPVITQAQTGAGQVNVQGRINSNPNTDYTIQFFSSPSADPSGFGQGQVYLGSIIVTTDPSGLAAFNTRVAGTVAVGQILTATATESGTQNTSNFSADVVLTPAPVTDLALTLVANPTANLLLGAPETYTLTVTNNGPDPATGVQVVSSLDPNSNYVSDTTTVGTSAQVGGVVTTTIGNLAAHQSATITIIVTAADMGTISINSTLSGNEIDSNSTNNTATAMVTVLPAADLSVQINPDPNPVAVNGTLTYVVSVTNKGPSVAHTLTLNDILDPSVTVVSADSPDGIVTIVGNTYTLNVDTLPVNTTATLTIVVTPKVVGILTNTANAQALEGDPVLGNNTATSHVNVKQAADLAIGVAVTNPGTIGQPLTYTFFVSNLGPFAATGAVFTDNLPTNAAFVSSDVNGTDAGVTPSNGILTIPLPTIPSGGSVLVHVVVQASVSEVVNNSANLTNTVELDSNPNNNTVVAPPVFISPADIAVSLVVPPVTFLNTPFTYTLTVKNTGPATATNVVATETFPNTLTLGQTTATGTATVNVTNGLLIANIPSLSSGESVVITINAVSLTASGPVSSTATVDPASTSNIDPNPLNNTSTATTVVSPADLAVTITPSTTAPLVGSPYTYTITVANAGPATADNVSITGALPSNVILQSSNAGQGGTITVSGGVYQVALTHLASGAFQRITLVVLPIATGPAQLTANVLSSEFDPDTTNNSATSSVSVINLPGTFQFASPVYTVNENGGLINVIVTRTGGTLGPVAVAFATTDGTAKAGVNYTPVAGVLNFLDGETSKIISIRVIDDGVITNPLNFNIGLIAVSPGGTLNPSASSATVTVLNTDVDLIPPTVLGVVPITDGRTITAIVLNFSKSLDPGPADLLQNYQVFSSSRNGLPAPGSHLIPLIRAVYNDGNHSVTLIPARPLAAGQFYGLVVNGTVATPIRDNHGNILDGDNNGVAGGNYSAIFGIGSTKLTYTDGTGNTVTLRLSGGGLMTLTRLANGDGDHLQLSGIVRGRSKLTGTVKRTKGHGSGITTLNSIDGFGNFADVLSHLSTPPFFVKSEIPTVTNPSPTLSFPSPLGSTPVVSAAVLHGPLAKASKTR